MNTMRYIFDKKLLGAISVVALLALPSFATTNNGCDNDNNDRINPEIALCTTHVYNIGLDKNAQDESQRQLMRNAVALKTTFMTQQMYKHYEYMETMIRRFKTQLEKAVLTTKIQVASGGNYGSGSSSSSSGGGISVGGTNPRNRDSNVVVDGARDCNAESTTPEVFQCVLDNINIALGALNDGKNAEAKQQLQKDYNIAVNYGRGQYNKTGLNKNEPANCKKMTNNAASIRKCADDLRPAVIGALDDYNNSRASRTPGT